MKIVIQPEIGERLERSAEAHHIDDVDTYVNMVLAARLDEEDADRAWGRAHREALERMVDEARASGLGRTTTPEEVGQFIRDAARTANDKRTAVTG